MNSIDESVSLLKEKGHPQAHLYPLGKLLAEAQLARRSYNRTVRTLTMALANTTPLGGFVTNSKKAMKQVKDFLENFRDGN